MKLLSLYIAAFGGVTDRRLTFEEGVTEILDRNGAGKSTLAAFIKVMLWGLEKTGNSLPDNENLLYEPWQGGIFGGTLTFETEGRVFRIERYYERAGKVKTPRGTLKIIDESTGLPTDRFGTEPGRALFGVDGPSFLRTAYLSPRAVSEWKTPEISAKLGGLEDEASDMASYQRAMDMLEEKRLAIRTRKRQTNGQKLLDLAERRLAECEAKIAEARAAAEAAAAEGREAREAKERAEELTLRLSVVEGERERRSREAAREESAEAMRAALRQRIAEAEAREREAARYFPEGTAPEAALDAIDANLHERERLAAIEATEPSALPPIPTDAEIREARLSLSRLAAARARIAEGKEAPHAEAPGHTEKTFLLFAALLALAGAVFLFISPLPGVLLLAVGAVLAILSLLLHRKTGMLRKRSEEAAAAVAREKAAATAECREAAREAATALAALGLAEGADEGDILAVQEAALAARLALAERERRLTRLAELDGALRHDLSAYRGLPTLPKDALPVLREAATALRDARRDLDTARRELTALGEAAPKKEETPTVAELSETVAACRRDLEAANADYHTATSREAGYRTLAEGLSRLLDERIALTAEIDELTRRLTLLDRTIDLMKAARAAYEETYLGAIRGSIGRYTDRLLGTKLGAARLDLDLNLTFENGGIGRELSYLSTGLRAIAEICLRLALTDALYPTSPPPLLLDDPFVALDEENLETARALLRELAKERQILYLTCHPSRSLTAK